MKRSIKVKADPLRQKAYGARDKKSLKAIWDALETLSKQGLFIGALAQTELVERQKIKDKFKKV